MRHPRFLHTVVFADTDRGGVIHVANIKGGVGKSTVATNLASALSEKGPTLVIDADVQGSASVALGVDSSDRTYSSWNLFQSRFSPDLKVGVAHLPVWVGKLLVWLRIAERKAFRWFVGNGKVTSLAVRVKTNLDLIPAGPGLFKNIRPDHLSNFLYNIKVCRSTYKYIVIDTPSVWNPMTRALFRASTLNLVPVTLNALSTKSLRDYLENVRLLARRYRDVHIRIVKNEVFGSQNSKIKGKTRTMSENRQFLERLCEQVMVANGTGMALLPETILFDLEIPESALVRDAQDEGKALNDCHQYSAIAKAFGELANRVQYVLNRFGDTSDCVRQALWFPQFRLVARLCAVAVLALILGWERPVEQRAVPRPVAPQQLVAVADRVYTHTFSAGESIYRIAKYAICRFSATVPSNGDVSRYALETVETHNFTRRDGEERITHPNSVSPGMTLNFYPPSFINNPREKQLLPVYEFFCSVVRDPFPYITGDWCERGTGGGTPHYGIDVAARLGAEIISPVDGTVVVRDLMAAGRTLAVVTEGSVIFFAHMDKRFFKTGDKVARGQALGTVGMTGRSSGPHVHIGYGVQTPGLDGLSFGRYRYKLTDPKLFVYRELFLGGVSG